MQLSLTLHCAETPDRMPQAVSTGTVYYGAGGGCWKGQSHSDAAHAVMCKNAPESL